MQRKWHANIRQEKHQKIGFPYFYIMKSHERVTQARKKLKKPAEINIGTAIHGPTQSNIFFTFSDQSGLVRHQILLVRGSRNRNTFLSNLKSGISGHGLTVKEVTEQVGDKEKGFILLYADDKLLEYYAEQLQIELPLSQVFKLMI